MYLILGAGLYLILANTQKNQADLKLIRKETPPASIELTEQSPDKSADEPDKDELDQIEEIDEEHEKLNK